MVDAKTPLATKTTVSSVSKVAGIRNDGTGDKVVLIEVDNLAAQLSLSSAGGLLTSTWAELDAIDGTTAGQAARVIGDEGSHTDPVSGAVGVDNSGEYSWSTSPAGWERIADLPPNEAYITAAIAAEETARIAADALKAPLASPPLSGVPTAPTASPGTNTTQIATTEFVTTADVAEATTRAATDASLQEQVTAAAAEASYATANAGAVAAVGAVASDYMHAVTDEDDVPLYGNLARDKSFHCQWMLSDELVEDIGSRISVGGSAASYNKSVVIFGDSRTYMATSTDSFMTNSFLFWLMTLTGQRFDFKFDMSLGNPTRTPPDPAVDNYGISGDTTGGLVARVQEMLDNTTASTIIMWVGTNDIESVSIATTIANVNSLLNTITNAGRRVILIAETGKGDADHTGGALTSNGLADFNQLHEYQLLHRSRVGVYVADARTAFIDPASTEGYNKVGYTYDGIHLTAKGGFDLAVEMQPLFEAMFPPVHILPTSNSELFSATHNPRGVLNTNPMLTGTSGSASGQISGDIATGYSCSGGSLGTATIVGSKGTGPNGIAKQIFTFSGTTGSSGSPNAGLLSQSILTNLNPGDTIEAVIGIDVTTALVGVTQIGLYISASDAGGVVASGMAGRRAGDGALVAEWPAETFSGGVMRTPKVKIPADVTLTAATISIVFAAPTSTAISGVVGFYALGVRKVNI